jgi:hypothetical protein
MSSAVALESWIAARTNSSVDPIVNMRSCVALLSVLASLLTACDSFSAEKIATPARDERAQHTLRSLVAGERDSVLAHARFGDDTAAIAKGLAQLDSILRGRRVDSIQLIGANQLLSGGTEQVTLSYEMYTERGWLGASVTTLDSATSWMLLGLHAQPLRGELRRLNQFSLGSRGLAQYLGLVLVVACTAFSLGVAVFLATRKQFPKRWRWVVASLIGAGAVYVNWTTGEVSSRLFTVQLFSASAVRPSEFAPWLISFSFPVGALVALERYRRWRARNEAVGVAADLTERAPSTEAAT